MLKKIRVKLMMSNVGKKIGIALLMLPLGLGIGVVPAQAGDQFNVRITSVFYAGGRFLFHTNANRTNAPACSCCPNRWEVLLSNDVQTQALISMIMTAYAQGKGIDVIGTGTCVVGSGDTEQIKWLTTF